MADRTAVIVGVGQGEWPVAPELDAVQQHALAAQRAVRDAGIAWSDLDGYMGAGGGGGAMVDDAIAHKERLDIDAIWMQLGVVDQAAAERARAAGIGVVMDTCPKIEWPRMRHGGMQR